MLNFIRRVWKDILHGENIDIYLTILISLFISISSLLNLQFVNLNTIPGITLSVLALIAISSLVGRFKVDDMSSKISPSIDSVFVNEFQSNLKEEFALANELWLTGASLSDVINDNYSLLEKKLKQGHFSIRVLVINPNNHDILLLSEMRAYANPNTQRARAKLDAILNDACALKDMYPKFVRVRVVDFPITYRSIAINPNSATGKFYISNYPFKTPGGSLPKFIVHARDQQWFEHYKLENNNLWDAGKDFECPVG